MIKKFKGRDYIRGFALLAAVFLLFLSILPWGEEYPHFMHWPAPQERRGGVDTNSFQFAFLSDLHKGWGVFKPMMQEIAKDGYAFAVIGGDIVVEGNEDRYRFFFRKLSEVKGNMPVYFVPGNHDLAEDNATRGLENFRKYCGPDYYWFSWGNAAFVLLNDAQATISEDQFRRLENTLQKLRVNFTHLFVFMHIPPFDPRVGKQYCLPKDVAEKFMRLMEKFGVDCVFSGHLHCYFREIINGVTYIGAPSAGGRSRCSNPSYGYIHIAVHGKDLKNSVVTAENNWRLQLIGDIQYELRVRSPFLLPFLTIALGQSFLYFLAA